MSGHVWWWTWRGRMYEKDWEYFDDYQHKVRIRYVKPWFREWRSQIYTTDRRWRTFLPFERFKPGDVWDGIER